MAQMKNTITQAAIDLFFKKGYYATSISEIARACGIQKASIYYHFASKEDLLFTIMQDTMAALTAYLRSNLEKVSGIEKRMRRAVSCHVHFHLEHQKETFIASSELRGLGKRNYLRIVAMRDEYEKIFQELIAAGTCQGAFTAGDVKILSYAILTLCTAGAFWFKPDGRLTVNEIAAIYENFIISGLKQGRIEKMAV